MIRNKITCLVFAVLLMFSLLASTAEATFPADEAGISAYVNVGQSIDLNKAKAVYRVVEYSTDTYIIGSVGLPNLPTTDDAHVYISRDGWIVAYYLKDEPASKIVQWGSSSSGANKLANAISIVASNLGAGYSTIKYYDFRYPTANKIMIITKMNSASPVSNKDFLDSFEFMIPSTYKIYELSWSFYQFNANTGGNVAQLKVDGNKISEISYGGIRYDKYQSYLSRDEFHKVEISSAWDSKAGGAIALIYQE